MLTKISNDEYVDGVETLVKFIFDNPTTNSASICANVLLSCYDGKRFHLQLTGLCSLDGYLYPAALAVIRGRIECFKEPHMMIDGGSKVFRHILDRYEHLTVINRAKQDCDNCNGLGKIYTDEDEYEQGRGMICSKCAGCGWTWPE